MNRLLLFLTATIACASAKPNIVVIMADDLGYECIAANGGTSYKTPHLDQMAKQGMRFEHCYSQPICTPSRVKLMTGISNIRNYVEFGLLDPKQTTFAHLLKKEGYATCVVGKWQLKGGMEGPGHFGFDDYALWQITRRPSRYPNGGLEVNGQNVDYTNGEYLPDVVSDHACNFIEKNKEQPFLLYYPMILTHCPFEPTPDSKDWDPKSPGSKTYKGDAKYFGDMVTYMDKIVGKILAKLDETGLRENTLVIFLGDNGTDKPVVSMMNGRKVVGAKGAMHDGGNRVPCIATWPGTVPAGTVSTEILDFSDVLPTLCEISGTATPDNIDGKSLLATLKAPKTKHRDHIYMWYSRSGQNKGARSFARNQRYKLYSDGKLYDIKNDVLEKKPLDLTALSDELKQTHTMLQSGLNKFHGQRPAHLGLPKKKKNKK
ncbi:MAG: sulfatase-like hydrolase/transferase [Akkermansiaceae bacterium]|nr:sulfatase-like hydrolase/transferase [Akkermansiaceae bacterium]